MEREQPRCQPWLGRNNKYPGVGAVGAVGREGGGAGASLRTAVLALALASVVRRRLGALSEGCCPALLPAPAQRGSLCLAAVRCSTLCPAVLALGCWCSLSTWEELG